MRNIIDALHIQTLAVLLFAAASGACGVNGSGSADQPDDSRDEPVRVVAHKSIDASSGGVIEVADSGSAIDGTRAVFPPGSLPQDTTVSISHVEDAATYPAGMLVVDVSPSVTLVNPAQLTLPYGEDLMRISGVTDPGELNLMFLDEATHRWECVPATSVDQDTRLVTGRVTHLSRWTVGPVPKTWQERDLVGQAFSASERNVLVIHGWNSSPSDDCTSGLTRMLGTAYQNVMAFQYPSAIDIGSNAAWLGKELLDRYPGVSFDIVAYSEGGLVARKLIEGVFPPGVVKRLVTIATPHLGIEDVWALAGAKLDPTAQALQQMESASGFLFELNLKPNQGATRYYTIAGDGAPGNTDGVVSIDSAFGRGVISVADTDRAVLPLLHTAIPFHAGMPCNEGVYDQLTGWLAAEPSSMTLKLKVAMTAHVYSAICETATGAGPSDVSVPPWELTVGPWALVTEGEYVIGPALVREGQHVIGNDAGASQSGIRLSGVDGTIMDTSVDLKVYYFSDNGEIGRGLGIIHLHGSLDGERVSGTASDLANRARGECFFAFGNSDPPQSGTFSGEITGWER